MVYWMIMALLLVVALGLIIAIIVTLKKNGRRQEEYEEDYDEYEEDDMDEEEELSVRLRQNRRESYESEPISVQDIQERHPHKKTKKQWKVILENLDTWEKFDFIFYDNIGIGRSRNNGEFEKFLTVKDDPRVSKVHCVIVQKEEQLYLKDIGSRNGTFLNGQRICQPTMIQRDDIISVGETKIEVKKVMRERE